MKAAEKIFIRKGANSATMDEIADVCELSKGTLYLYFRNKDELFFSIMVSIMDNYIKITESNLRKLTVYEERLASLGESYLEFYRKYPNQFILMNLTDHHTEEFKPGKELGIQMIERNNRLWSTVESVIQEGMDLGIFRPDISPMQTGITIWASSNGMIQLMEHIRVSHNDIPPEMIKEYGDIIFHKLTEMDVEKMLRDLWNAIFNSIRTQPDTKPPEGGTTNFGGGQV